MCHSTIQYQFTVVIKYKSLVVFLLSMATILIKLSKIDLQHIRLEEFSTIFTHAVTVAPTGSAPAGGL